MESEKRQSAIKTAAMKAEYDTIQEALNQVNGNKSKAAKLLSIDRKTLYNKLQQYKSKIV